MRTYPVSRILFGLGAIVAVAVVAFIGGLADAADPSGQFRLTAPSFVSVAEASEAAVPQNGTQYIVEAAGISAYTKIAQTIDLALVRDSFRGIEYETDNYIIGTVPLPDYDENHDPHLYVNKNGWVVAYFLSPEGSAYIADLRHYDGNSGFDSKLEIAMAEILSNVGIVDFDTTYYDFRYPNATTLTIAVDYYADPDIGPDTMQIQLPGGILYDERSWSFASRVWGYPSILTFNDDTISTLDGTNGEWYYDRGSLTASEMPPNVFHEFEIERDGGFSVAAAVAITFQE